MNLSRSLDIGRSLGNAWQAIKAAPGPLLVGGVLLSFLSGFGGGGLDFEELDHVDGDELAALVLIIVGACVCIGIPIFLFTSWLRVGFLDAVEETLRRGSCTFGQLFDTRSRRWIDMALLRLLRVVLALVAALPFGMVIGVGIFLAERGGMDGDVAGVAALIAALVYLPFFVYVVLGLVLAPYALVYDRLQPVDALKVSWETAAGNRLALFGYSIVTAIVALLGLLACCVGVYLTSAWVEIAWAEVYLQHARSDEIRGWWIEGSGTPPADEAPQDWDRDPWGDQERGGPGAPPPPLPPQA